MPKRIDEKEFERLDNKVYDSQEIVDPVPRGKLSVSVTLKDGVPFFLQAGDTIDGSINGKNFKGYFDGFVKYDPIKGWAIQVRTGKMEAVNIHFEELDSLKIYD